MARLYGAQRMVLQAVVSAQADTQEFIGDGQISQATNIALTDIRDWLLTLDHDELVDPALTENGMSASATAKGRLALGPYRPFPSAPKAPSPEPARARAKTGRERALVIGISNYPQPIGTLPAVANDVREIAELFRSDNGLFRHENVTSLVDQEAKRDALIRALDAAFQRVRPDDSAFVYMAGHGAVFKDCYYFVAHDTDHDRLPSTGLPLARIKSAFDSSASRRAFLWLDFCHSGGILARDLVGEMDDNVLIDRALKLVRGEGKLILAACTPEQKAYEIGHGLFTGALLKGLKGGAVKDKEVTVNSLFDFIDRQIGSDRQRPMMFGQMTGRVVLMRYA